MVKFMDMFFEVIIAAALFAPLISYVTAATENASVTTALLWGLVPVLYVIAVVYVIYAQVKKR